MKKLYIIIKNIIESIINQIQINILISLLFIDIIVHGRNDSLHSEFSDSRITKQAYLPLPPPPALRPHLL